MDFNTLKNLNVKDLKNINPKMIQEFVKTQTDILIIILLIVVTICATIFIYNDSQRKISSMKSGIAAAEEKVKVVGEYEKIEKDFNAFKEKIPKPISSDQFIDKLSEFALKNNVQIFSISKPQNSGGEILELTTISFNVAAEDYPHLLSFIKDIESSPFALRLNKFNASLQQIGSEGRRPIKNTSKLIIVDLEIGLLNLKIWRV